MTFRNYLKTMVYVEKKFTKALDNFSYNLALLHGQTDLLNKAKQDANITIRQVRRQSLVNKSLSFSFRSLKQRKQLIYSNNPMNKLLSKIFPGVGLFFMIFDLFLLLFYTCAYMCMHTYI